MEMCLIQGEGSGAFEEVFVVRSSLSLGVQESNPLGSEKGVLGVRVLLTKEGDGWMGGRMRKTDGLTDRETDRETERRTVRMTTKTDRLTDRQ